jgi:hypothetical protein
MISKRLLAAILFVAIASVLSAAPILISDGFTSIPGQGIVAPISAGDTAILFSNLTFSGPSCSGPNAALCTASSVTAATFAFISGVAETFNFGTLSYTTSGPWSVIASGGGTGFLIQTLGTYAAAGFTNTAGELNITFQRPPVGDNFTFSASGKTNPVPEPVTASLIGVGLVGLGLLRRKRRP